MDRTDRINLIKTIINELTELNIYEAREIALILWVSQTWLWSFLNDIHEIRDSQLDKIENVFLTKRQIIRKDINEQKKKADKLINNLELIQ